MLPRATLPQAFYCVRSERQLMEQIDYNLPFRWFVGLPMDANREHQLEITRLIQTAGHGFRRLPVVVVLNVGAARRLADAALVHRAVGRPSLWPQGRRRDVRFLIDATRDTPRRASGGGRCASKGRKGPREPARRACRALAARASAAVDLPAPKFLVSKL